MAGYNGYSMSNNAVSAYDDGEKPMSKWTKKAFCCAIDDYSEDVVYGVSREVKEALKGLNVAALRTLLVKSSRHHTSCKYNYTDFYFLDLFLVTLDDVTELKENKLINVK